MTHGEDIFIVDHCFSFHPCHDLIEEFDVPVSQFSDFVLPAVFGSLGVGSSCGGESVHVDRNGVGDGFVEFEPAHGVVHVSAVSVEGKDDGTRAGISCFGEVHIELAFCAVDLNFDGFYTVGLLVGPLLA